MLTNIWEKFVTNNYKFSVTDPVYRRVYLLNSILFIGIIVAFSFVILNIVFFTTIYLVVLTSFSTVLLACIAFYFHKTHKINWIALITTLLQVIIFSEV